MTKIKLPRAVDPSRKIMLPKSKSCSSKASAASEPVPVIARKSSKDLVSVITKRHTATSCQRRKQHNVLCKHEKLTSDTYLITYQLSGEKSSRPLLMKTSSRKRAWELDSEGEGEGEDDDGDQESDVELEDLSVSDEEREVVIRNAKKKLEQLLAETTSLVDELEKMEDDVQRLQDEKVALLEQLLACEGLAVNPYPPFRPLSRKIKLLRTRV